MEDWLIFRPVAAVATSDVLSHDGSAQPQSIKAGVGLDFDDLRAHIRQQMRRHGRGEGRAEIEHAVSRKRIS
jgi:hypothetical protein